MISVHTVFNCVSTSMVSVMLTRLYRNNFSRNNLFTASLTWYKNSYYKIQGFRFATKYTCFCFKQPRSPNFCLKMYTYHEFQYKQIILAGLTQSTWEKEYSFFFHIDLSRGIVLSKAIEKELLYTTTKSNNVYILGNHFLLKNLQKLELFW